MSDENEVTGWSQKAAARGDNSGKGGRTRSAKIDAYVENANTGSKTHPAAAAASSSSDDFKPAAKPSSVAPSESKPKSNVYGSPISEPILKGGK